MFITGVYSVKLSQLCLGDISLSQILYHQSPRIVFAIGHSNLVNKTFFDNVLVTRCNVTLGNV